MKCNVLVSDALADAGIDVLRESCNVTVKLGLTEAQIVKEIGKYHGLVVRSGTRVTKKIIKAARNLKIIARAGVGVDNIDAAAATDAGIVVINSPRGNTLSAAEHALSLMMAMVRNIPAADRSLRQGQWDRKTFVGTEVFHKTLGLLGLGKVGGVVAERAMAMGMKVIAFDPFASEEHAKRIGVGLVGFTTVLKQADIISLHMPHTRDTHHLIGAKELRIMKKGVRIVNAARGGLIDEDALFKALVSGKVAQAALDVFENEPATDNPLLTLPNVIATPHLGASTMEAQVNVAVDVARQIVDFFNGIPPKSAINMPSVKPEIIASHKPYFELAEKIGLFHAQLLDGNIQSIHITYAGRSAGMETELITRYLLVGFLRPTMQDSVNFVNAPVLISNRGVKLTETTVEQAAKYKDLITVKVVTSKRTREVAGTLYDMDEIRIVMVDDYWMELVPQGHVLYVRHKDQPGLVGKVGTLLGDRNINIAGMQVGRENVRGRAIMCLTIDDDISKETIEALSKIKGVASVRLLTL
jgi:D-3-phosphoglycerate dehydrogenase